MTSGEHNIGMKADNTKEHWQAGSGASLINDMLGINKVGISDGATVNASSLTVGASDNWNLHAAEGRMPLTPVFTEHLSVPALKRAIQKIVLSRSISVKMRF